MFFNLYGYEWRPETFAVTTNAQPSSSLFFLTWLASLRPGPNSCDDRLAPGARICPTSRLSCSVRLGQVLTFFTSSADSRDPPIEPPLGANGANALSSAYFVISFASETTS